MGAYKRKTMIQNPNGGWQNIGEGRIGMILDIR